jgi:hypothetical protein
MFARSGALMPVTVTAEPGATNSRCSNERAAPRLKVAGATGDRFTPFVRFVSRRMTSFPGSC